MQSFYCTVHSNAACRFLVDYEHLALTIIGDLILLYDISQSNNLGDGSLAEPICFVIARHFCLLGHYHDTTVAIESHNAAGLECICDQFRVTKEIHHVLTFQKYDLPDVQLIVEIWRLIEDLGDVWLEFSG